MPVTVSVIPEPAAGAPYFDEAYGFSRYIDVTIPTYNFTTDGDCHIVIVHSIYFEYPFGPTPNGFYSYIGGNGLPPTHGHSCAIPMSAVTAYQGGQIPNYDNTEVIFSEFVAAGQAYTDYQDPGSAFYPAFDRYAYAAGACSRWEVISRPKSGTTYRVLLDMAGFISTMVPNVYYATQWPSSGTISFDQNQAGHACVFVVSGVEWKSLAPEFFSGQTADFERVSFSASQFPIGNFLYSGYSDGLTEAFGLFQFHASRNSVVKGVGSTEITQVAHNGYYSDYPYNSTWVPMENYGVGGQILTACVTAGPLTANPTFSTGETNTSGFLSTKSSPNAPATTVASDGTVGYMPFHVSFSTKPIPNNTASLPQPGYTPISRTRPSWGPFTQSYGDNNLIDAPSLLLQGIFVKPFNGKTSFSGKKLDGQPLIGAGFLPSYMPKTYIEPKTLDGVQSGFTIVSPTPRTSPNPQYPDSVTTPPFESPLKMVPLPKTSYIVTKRITDMIPETMYSYWN
ncbi:hypothetical protein UFOVP967_21 [uncultured Caudovirales phage]|uniref:Uncharacterized protein n=1 Tax=uncultured Caudovirales phage TaxID=2100421 RepID=A0A6J5SXK6_9CAUD|nr:hypothetical protein UFOVP521_95 [uncultured Caudovirales phage]CAB4167874.1 hypothetical protein UFOVP856_67 [uncultured Caudovirales phage]CAB4174011.1 hypothetical protein UFOVP967_21 [uncultured Caudovirales phage]CAB4180603.1 hypothetical protein UFOVP1036_60 [uncultured Caudovirales phage]CAB4186060.1 hypothetical protein UFOVP1132_7 [uncultured Caudovirales phage]